MVSFDYLGEMIGLLADISEDARYYYHVVLEKVMIMIILIAIWS